MSPLGDVVSVGVVLALVGATGLAVQSLAIRYGTVETDSSSALVLILLVNLTILVPVTFVVENPIEALTLRSLAAFAGAGLVGTMAGRAFHFESIKRIGSTRTEPIKSSQPLHASLIALVVLGETFTADHLLSMVAIVIGIAVISYEHSHSEGTADDSNYTSLLLPLTAALFYGIEPTFASLGFAGGTPVLTGLVVKTSSAGLGFLTYLAWQQGLPRPADVAPSELHWLVGAGLANTVFLLGYYAALETEPVATIVPLVQSSPLLVIAISIAFVSDDLERVTWRLTAGALIAMMGAIGVTLSG